MKKTKKIPNTPKYKFGGGFDSKDKANVRNFIGNSAKMYADTALNAVGVDAVGAGKGMEYKGTSANKFNQASNVTGAVSKAVAPAVANVLLPGSGQFVSMGQQVAGGAYGKFGPQNEQGFNAYDADGNPIMNENDNSAQVAQIAGQVGGMASGFMGGSPGGGAAGAGAAAGMFARYGGQMKFAMGGMQYANGGTGEINAEVEKEENAVTPQGQFTQFNGPSHSQGGIKTDMAPGTRVFSDKLKAPGTNKTFAKLNAGNNTNREDKLDSKEYLDPKSKMSIDLTRMAKMKNSDMLFAMQEQLKKEKVAAYARRMGVELPPMDNEQMEPQGMLEQSEGEMGMARYGGMYASGGIHINPANKGKFTASAQRAGMGTQEFARHVLANKEDYSSTQVKRANFAHNAAGWKHEMGGVNNPGFNALPEEVQQNILSNMAMGGVQLPYYNTNNDGTPKYVIGGLTKPQYEQAQADSMNLYNAGLKSNKIPSWQVPGAIESAGRLTALNNQAPMPTKGVFYGNESNYNGGYNVSFKKPTMVPYNMQTIDKKEQVTNVNKKPAIPERDPNRPTWNFNSGDNPSFGGVSYTNAAGTGKVIPPTTLKYGGKLPKYEYGIRVPIGPEDPNTPVEMVPSQIYNPYGGVPNAPVFNPSRYGQNQYDPNDLQLKGNTTITETPNDALSTFRKQNPSTSDTGDNESFDWKGVAGNVANFAAQNAGNIYNLSRYNKPEVETYERAKAKYLDPTQARNDEQYNYRQSLENVRTGSMGSGATLLANTNAARNRASVNTARINKEYENANAQIGNENNRYNTELAYREVIANAQNRARNRSGKGEAIGDIGEKFGMATKANKQGQVDQETLKLMMEYYNTPEFQKKMKNSKLKKTT